MTHKFIATMQKISWENTFEKLSESKARELLQLWGEKYTEMTGGGMWWGSRFKTEDEKFFVYNRKYSAWMGPFDGIEDALSDDHVVANVAIVGHEINYTTVAQTCLYEATEDFWRFHAKEDLLAALRGQDKPVEWPLKNAMDEFNRHLGKKIDADQFKKLALSIGKSSDWIKTALPLIKERLAQERDKEKS